MFDSSQPRVGKKAYSLPKSAPFHSTRPAKAHTALRLSFSGTQPKVERMFTEAALRFEKEKGAPE